MQLTGLWDGYLRLSIIPMAKKNLQLLSPTGEIKNIKHHQSMKTTSTKTWDTFNNRKLTNEQLYDTTLMILMWHFQNYFKLLSNETPLKKDGIEWIQQIPAPKRGCSKCPSSPCHCSRKSLRLPGGERGKRSTAASPARPHGHGGLGQDQGSRSDMSLYLKKRTFHLRTCL